MILTVLFDPTAPGPIGGTTPAAGTFTSLACPTYTSAAAMGFTPASGSGFNITLATTGDFAVNTNQLYVDTSTGNVGIGTTSPLAKLHSAAVDNSYSFGLSGTTNGMRVETSPTMLTLRGVDATLTSSYQPLGIGGSYLVFYTNGLTEAARIDSAGNVLIGATAAGTSAAKVLGVGNGTAPSTSPADMVQIWAEDVAASSELRVRDEAGNVTTLSPHAKDAPPTMYDRGAGLDRIVRSANHYVGEIEWTNESRMARISQMTPNELAALSANQREVYRLETFADYNTRRQNEPGHTPLDIEDWDTNQDAITAESVKAISDWEAMPVESRQPVKPKPYIKKTKPTWVL